MARRSGRRRLSTHYRRPSGDTRATAAHTLAAVSGEALQFKTRPTGATVARALRAVTVASMVVPLFALAALLDRPHVRSWTALGLTLGLGAVCALSFVSDRRRLRRARLSAFVATRAFTQTVLVIADFAAAGVAFGLHGGSFLLLPLIAFLATALLGNGTMMRRGWLVLVVALAVETGLELPAYDALWSTVLFAGTGAVLAVTVDHVVRGSMRGMERNRVLAELATETAMFQDWPRDLLSMGERLARAMDVERYAVLTRLGSRTPLERSYAWPDPEWPTFEEVGDLAVAALERAGPVESDGLCATGVHAGTAGVVIVAPSTSLLAAPVEPTVLTSAAALVASMLTRSRLISGLLDMANTDELTGLANRRRLFETLQLEIGRARRSRRPLTIAMVDLDHFKRYNDTFGHSAGDDLLQHFALRTTSRTRAQDLVARYGGEEFCMVLPETDAEGAVALVEGLRHEGAGDDRLGRRVTFSAGLATWNGSESAEDLVYRADASLYRAKAAGRDQVAVARAS